MQRMIFTAIVICSLTTVFAQQVPSDCLYRYSYTLSGAYIDKGRAIPVGGTCYIIRRNSKTWVVTARHVVDGCEGKVKLPKFPKQLILAIFDDSLNFKDALNLDISSIVNTSTCPTTHPDVVAIELNVPKMNQLNSVEKFIMPPLPDNGDVSVWGFPSVGYATHPSGYGLVPPAHLSYKSLENQYFHEYLTDSITGIKDSSMYSIANKNINYKDSSFSGFSGSPIFYKQNTDSKVRLMGTLSATGRSVEAENDLLIFTNIEEAINIIDQKSKQ